MQEILCKLEFSCYDGLGRCSSKYDCEAKHAKRDDLYNEFTVWFLMMDVVEL